MNRLEMLEGDAWQQLVAAPAAVLVLAKTTCEACRAWSEELTRFLETDQRWAHVRFGKIYLDTGGLASFKRAAKDWLASVEDLPCNVLYVDGQKVKAWPGGGVERLVTRLEAIGS